MTRVKMIFGKHFRFSLSSFLTGALSGLTIKIFGSVYIGEILSLFFFAASQGTGKRPFSLIPKPIFVLALLWAAAQACSDIVNNTEFADSLKGIGAPVLMLFSMAGLSSFFSRDHRRCPSFLLGLPLGLFVDVVLLNPTYYFLTDNQWKWGYGSNIMSFTIVLTSFFVKQSKSFLDHFSIFLVLAGLSIIGLLNESRSSLSVLITYGLFLLLRIRFFQGLLNSMNRIRPAGTYLLISFVSAGLIVLSLSLGYIFINTPIASLLPHATYQKTFKHLDFWRVVDLSFLPLLWLFWTSRC
jgi:hypothetical protein